MPTPEAMAALTEGVLARYAEKIPGTDPEQLRHLSERFESLPRSPFAVRVREMADAELALRAHTGGTR